LPSGTPGYSEFLRGISNIGIGSGGPSPAPLHSEGLVQPFGVAGAAEPRAARGGRRQAVMATRQDRCEAVERGETQFVVRGVAPFEMAIGAKQPEQDVVLAPAAPWHSIIDPCAPPARRKRACA